jgi:hypothetical protein
VPLPDPGEPPLGGGVQALGVDAGPRCIAAHAVTVPAPRCRASYTPGSSGY